LAGAYTVNAKVTLFTDNPRHPVDSRGRFEVEQRCGRGLHGQLKITPQEKDIDP